MSVVDHSQENLSPMNSQSLSDAKRAFQKAKRGLRRRLGHTSDKLDEPEHERLW